jgi:PhnB protein
LTFNRLIEYYWLMFTPAPYVLFPGNAREALQFYATTFDGNLVLNTFAEFSRSDGPPDAIAHGILRGPVQMFGSDTGSNDTPVRIEGLLLSLLGAAEPVVLHRWFDRLAEGGTVLDPLAVRPWGASDGQVLDRFGLRWLLGYEPS